MSTSCANCEHSIYKLNILVPDHIDLKEYISKAQGVFSSPIIAFLKDNADTCTIRSYSGKELKEIQINLAYECKLGLEDDSVECQCKFTYKNNPAMIEKTVYRQRQTAEKIELHLNDVEYTQSNYKQQTQN